MEDKKRDETIKRKGEGKLNTVRIGKKNKDYEMSIDILPEWL